MDISYTIPGDRCRQCKKDRSHTLLKYEKIRFNLDLWYGLLSGIRLGLCVGFWTPGRDARFFDLVFLRKNPVQYLGVPLQVNEFDKFYHEDSRSQFQSPSTSIMSMPDVFSNRSNCIFDFISNLDFYPLYIIYAVKNSAAAVGNEWHCFYSSDPVVIDTRLIQIPMSEKKTTPKSTKDRLQ